MPLEFRADEVCLTDTCVAEEALQLADWLAKNAGRARVNLAACVNMHTALLQTLMAYKPAVSVEPTDPFLRRWVVPLLGSDSDPVKDIQP